MDGAAGELWKRIGRDQCGRWGSRLPEPHSKKVRDGNTRQGRRARGGICSVWSATQDLLRYLSSSRVEFFANYSMGATQYKCG